MKIIEQNYEILSLPKNPLNLIEQASRVCYKSEHKIGCTEKHDNDGLCPYIVLDYYHDHCINTSCSSHSSHKIVAMLSKKGHLAMIEFGDIAVKFITDRGVSHELVRHRLFSFAQESTRYVKYDGEMEFIRPVWCSEKIIGSWPNRKPFPQMNISQTDYDFMFCCEMTECNYQDLLNKGWRPQKARTVLINSLKTEIVVKGNYREWLHTFKLRTNPKAHPQFQQLLLPLLEQLKTDIPILFDNI